MVKVYTIYFSPYKLLYRVRSHQTIPSSYLGDICSTVFYKTKILKSVILGLLIHCSRYYKLQNQYHQIDLCSSTYLIIIIIKAYVIATNSEKFHRLVGKKSIDESNIF